MGPFRAADYGQTRDVNNSGVIGKHGISKTWRVRDSFSRISDGLTNTIFIGEKQIYRVYFGGYEPYLEKAPIYDDQGNMISPPIMVHLDPPMTEKYLRPDTSELVCEVKGRTVFNITVEPAE